MAGLPREQRRQRFRALMTELSDARTEKMDLFAQRLNEDRRNRERVQQSVALGISRISPASVFALASTDLAGTSLQLKERYLDSAAEYREGYLRFMKEKTGSTGGAWWSGGREESSEEIDPLELPVFDYQEASTAEHINGALPDIGILASIQSDLLRGCVPGLPPIRREVDDMFWLLVEKELKAIILSPKFVATFGICSLLMLLSLFIGIQEYNHSVATYHTARQLTDRQLQGEDSWWGVQTKAFREPDAMQVFVSGVDYDVGRLSQISTWTEVKLESSVYSDDSLFAIFRFVDFTFIVQVVLSLFAILFTYDAINGERESGTLKLALSNAVPRARYVLAKFVGSWIGLTVPILIPILLAVLTVILLGIPMSDGGWPKLAMLLLASVLYFTFFIAFGILVSALTKRSAVSFLILLVTWVALVLIIPRAATMAAGQVVHVDSVAELDAKKDRYSTDRWMAYRDSRMRLRDERDQVTSGMTREERETYEAANREAWVQEEEDLRQETMEEIGAYARKLDEERNNQKGQMQQVAFGVVAVLPVILLPDCCHEPRRDKRGHEDTVRGCDARLPPGLHDLCERQTRGRAAAVAWSGASGARRFRRTAGSLRASALSSARTLVCAGGRTGHRGFGSPDALLDCCICRRVCGLLALRRPLISSKPPKSDI